MNISYGQALSNGWSRMKKALFNPFDLGKWFTIGFTAFLAGLADGSGFGGGGHHNLGKHNMNFENLADYPRTAWQWLLDNPLWFMLIGLVILFLFALGVLLVWLSSRGKFMFLDNVVHNRSLVSRPWNRFKALGDSLFLWRLCFGIIMMAVIILFFFFAYFEFLYFHGSGISGLTIGLTITAMVLCFFAICIIAGYINLFLSHFVVPIMYKNNIGAVEAWRRFIYLLSGHLLHFFLYGIIILLLNILVFICVAVIGLCTCCIGFLLLIIPYIGSVVLLPVSYTFRAMSVEFLEQFGPEYKIFPKLYDDPDEVYEL